MTSAETIVADVRKAIDVLTDTNDASATRVAAALTRMLAGELFASALNLPSDWRDRIATTARDRALVALVAAHPGLSANALADFIAGEVRRMAARPKITRPDGPVGYLWDLARSGCCPGARQLRRLIADRVGHQDACNGQRGPASSATEEI